MWWIIGIGVVVVLLVINYISNLKKKNSELNTVVQSAVDLSKLAMEDPEKAKLAMLSESDDEFAKRVFYKDKIRQYLIGIRSVDYHEENRTTHPEKYETQNGKLVLKHEFDNEIAEYITKWREEVPDPEHSQKGYELVIRTPENAPLEQFTAAYKAGYSLCFEATDYKRPWQEKKSDK